MKNEDDQFVFRLNRRKEENYSLRLFKDYFSAVEKFFRHLRNKNENLQASLGLLIDDGDIASARELIIRHGKTIPTQLQRSKGEIVVLRYVEQSRDALVTLFNKRSDEQEKISSMLARLKSAELVFKQQAKLKSFVALEVFDIDKEIERMFRKADAGSQRSLDNILNFFVNNQDNLQVYPIIGELFFNKNNYSLANDFLKTATIAFPFSSALWMYYGISLSREGRFNESLDVLHQAEKMDNKNLEIKRNIGWTTAMLGAVKNNTRDIADGRMQLMQVIKRGGERVDVILDLSQTYLMEYDFLQAITWIKKALVMQPKNGLAIRMLQEAQIMQDAFKKLNINKNGDNNIVLTEKSKELISVADKSNWDKVISRHFKIEGLISGLGSGNLTTAELGQILEQLKENGAVIQNVLPQEKNAAEEYIKQRNKRQARSRRMTNLLINKKIEILKDKKSSIEDKKKAIISLAGEPNESIVLWLVEFIKKNRGILKVWAKFALAECEAALE